MYQFGYNASMSNEQTQGPKKWRVAGISFDHMHMGDLLRQVFEHPQAEIVGIADPDKGRMERAVQNFGLSPAQVFTDFHECLRQTGPTL
jgi:glucose-fructose oxidoreductase